MTVRRGAARLAVVGVLLGGLLVVGAAPALADDDTVRVRSASSFTAGGSAGTVSVEVRKRTEGCVLLRTGLRLRLDGVRADQVRVEAGAGGQWWPVPVSGGEVLGTARTAPANPTLCKGKSVTVRYRLTFLAGAPGGSLTVAGEAFTATGRTIGRNSDTAKVVGGRATPSPTPKRTPTPTPTPSPEATEAATAGAQNAPTLAAVGSGGGQAAEENGSDGGGVSLVMVFGVGMVVVGLGLIALLFRRSRAEKDDAGPGLPEIPLPRNPGGTTYRSGGGYPGPAGSQPTGYPAPAGGPSTGYPAPAGGQSGYSGYPAAPASGTVYPSRPQSGTGYSTPQAGPPGTGYPAPQAGQPGPPSGNQATPPPPAPSGGGDSTVLMPRLPD